MTVLTIAVDGACLGNPGPGGWGMVVMHGDQQIHTDSGAERHTTNNRMEMQGAINALYFINNHKPEGVTRTVILSDSQYVIKGITEWIHGWKAKGWVNSSKKPVVNKDLWELLDFLNRTLEPEWQWVRGHDGHPLNEAADALANAAAGIN